MGANYNFRNAPYKFQLFEQLHRIDPIFTPMYIAGQLHLTKEGIYKKARGTTQFTLSEILILLDLTAPYGVSFQQLAAWCNNEQGY